MKEIWELAISAPMLPLTILLVPVGLYWLLTLVGIAGHGIFHGHGHHHVGGHHHHDVGHVGHHGHVHAHGQHSVGHAHHGHTHGHGNGHHHHGDGEHHFFSDLLHGALRIVNAEEVPLMSVLSILIVFLWGGAMLGNYWYNPDAAGWGGILVIVGALFASVILTRLVLTPLKPLFRLLQNDAEPETPMIGRTGYVRTAVVDEKYGQVVVDNRGAPIIVGARIAHGSEPISRNGIVLLVDRDEESGLYVVKASNEISH